ncbi:MAG: response regulator, partial [Candidatus Sericytochromatia bacterium]|nr:response regulator [Candidatus Sericytochromatia bacterium]
VRHLRVLVAEDDPISQEALRTLVGSRGHEVVVVGNGTEAPALAKSGPFDLAILDLQIPFMDGLSVCRAIREWERQDPCSRLPLVMLTAHASPQWAELCREQGIDLYLTKPLQADALAAIFAFVAGDGEPVASLPDDDTGVASRQVGPPALDPETVDVVRRAFRQDAPELMIRLRGAWDQGDLAATAHWAHRIAGGLAYLEAARNGGPGRKARAGRGPSRRLGLAFSADRPTGVTVCGTGSGVGPRAGNSRPDPLLKTSRRSSGPRGVAIGRLTARCHGWVTVVRHANLRGKRDSRLHTGVAGGNPSDRKSLLLMCGRECPHWANRHAVTPRKHSNNAFLTHSLAWTSASLKVVISFLGQPAGVWHA